ncbi:MAG: tetratricopeptide repeat protein [Bacteroidetes bacterium]|nr:tetratricopeptide repeat protein [Bacteroidota bacterium]
MKRVLVLLLLVLTSLGISAQKTRVLSVIQMIDQGKYAEAKEAIELAVWNDKTSSWARTYFVRGLLCQTAYEDGFTKKDTKKTELYADQLYLAYSSYERALEMDARKRHHSSISLQYIHLSNDFRKLGQRQFNNQEYDQALRAFEYALLVNKSPLIHAKVDTNLIYNTAMAAYESKNWGKAIGYLTGLHELGQAPSTSLLLYQAFIETGDSARAEEVLFEAAEIYNYENQVVVHLINLFARTGRNDQALGVLDMAIKNQPGNHKFLWGQGLIYRSMGELDKAIESFKAALRVAPDEPKISYHIGLIYFNQGIDLTEQSLKIANSNKYLEIKELARERFKEAVTWLEESFEMDPYNEQIISKLYQLYYQLQMKEKEESMRLLME